LPAIFNPEDLNALEEALALKEQHGGTVTVITMGPPNAAEVLREALFRGADDVILLSDRKFAGADTLATSYVLCQAIKKVGDYDLVLCGRQAIDGDTAQVGPQTAEKLGINQITCVDRIVELNARTITAERSIEGGYEIVKAKLPILLTITDEANIPRPPAAKKVLAYKHAMTPLEIRDYDEEYLRTTEIEESHVMIKLWDHQEIGVAPEQCGLSGSPTKVKQIESVVLEAGAFKQIENSKAGLESLITELLNEHIIG
ncbi:electron transfer flavoprotein beta subunit/FixA family protein, partial [candidate division KSB3 bacterium]|nr:electron transfer flavoprotein beta subunit/FixA family protein [candidate division KSB3 bacterium]MBD3327271.1 electron transfer flavoprotein beta subunit/FixA family protein [candidate division KSB3 bacterium]